MPLHCIALAAALVLAPLPDVHATLRACAGGAPDRCAQLKAELAATFGGTTIEDRRLGSALATRLVRVVVRPTRELKRAIRACAESECRQLGWVVSQLFTGGDAILDRSRARPLARALAAHMTDSEESSCASH